MDGTLARLNGEGALEYLRTLAKDAKPNNTRDVNNHIHTTYSFSPYSPAAAVWFAHEAGLCTCGLMDHDTIAGADEFLAACDIMGMPGTIGLECRVSMRETPFFARRINNPDQDGIIYMALHGVPHDKVSRLNGFFAPYREKRNVRNRAMTARINEYMRPFGIAIDFDRDVVPLSNFDKGGAITERHLSLALAKKLLDQGDVVGFIKGTLGLPITEKIEGYLRDEENAYRVYDLLGWIKSELISKFYIDATDECPDVREVLALSEEIGAISAYAYLGDVGDSVTGDKKTQKFEDDFLPELLSYLKELGFRAVTYMPSRNTKPQLDRLRALLKEHNFFQISGEDINSPRQSFVCQAQRAKEFDNLYDATYALIAHELRATDDREKGFFSKASEETWPNLDERTRAFAEAAKHP